VASTNIEWKAQVKGGRRGKRGGHGGVPCVLLFFYARSLTPVQKGKVPQMGKHVFPATAILSNAFSRRALCVGGGEKYKGRDQNDYQADWPNSIGVPVLILKYKSSRKIGRRREGGRRGGEFSTS